MIISIIFFLIIFLLIVVSHEFGHYIVAKKNGIQAVEFFVGIGPKLVKWNKDGTEFSIRLFPFGGACVFAGMDALEDEKITNVEDLPDGAFQKAPVWGRIATSIAGPLFNILLAYICGVILASTTGVVIPEIQTVVEESGAEKAGLMPGDIITRLNGHSVHLSAEVSFTSYFSEGKPIKVTVKRGKEKVNTVVIPQYDEEDERYYMGITNGKYLECNTANSLLYGFYNVEYILKATIESIRMMFTGQVGKDGLSGPVGMVKMVDETYEFAKNYGVMQVLMSMLDLLLMLSANLAVMNLLPIPALDGGRLVFLFIEAIRGKPIPPEKEGYVHLAGMAFLMVVVIMVLFNDISKFFR